MQGSDTRDLGKGIERDETEGDNDPKGTGLAENKALIKVNSAKGWMIRGGDSSIKLFERGWSIGKT